MRNFLLLLFALFAISCNSDVEREANKEEQDAKQTIAMQNFARSLDAVSDVYSDSVALNALYESIEQREIRSIANSEEEEKARDNLADLLGSSYSLLEAENVQDVNTLTDEELFTVGLLVYADKMQASSRETKGGAISGNHIVDCAMSALGISELGSIAAGGISNYISKYGAKQALKTFAKFAGKSLSYVGMALAVVDFATCL